MIFRWVPVPIESLKQMRLCERVENETETAGTAEVMVQTNLGILRRCRIRDSTAVAPHLGISCAEQRGNARNTRILHGSTVDRCSGTLTRTRETGKASTRLRSGHANLSQGTHCFLRRSLPAALVHLRGPRVSRAF